MQLKVFRKLSLSIAIIIALSPPAFAGELLQWHTTNIQYLRGWEHELGEEKRHIMTLEHANGWKYGDFYGFADFTKNDGYKAGKNVYAEFSPRFSLSKITGKNFSTSIIKDILIATTIEKVKNTGIHYLYGGAVDLKIPGFKYFKTNFYVRDDSEAKGKTWQVTLGWNYPIEVAGVKFLLEGFADFAGREGHKNSNQLVVPRFLIDVGDLAHQQAGKFWVGLELQSWHNKFGVKGKSETVPQLQFKYVF